MRSNTVYLYIFTALLALAALTLGPPPAQAAVTEAWVHRYSNVVSNSNDGVAKMVRDAAGDIVVTGSSGSDMLTLKYSGANGSVLWQRRYNHAAAKAVVADSSGNVLVTGSSYTNPDSVGANEYNYTAKYAAVDGALLWEKSYNGPANTHDFTTALVVDNSGNVVVTGTSYNPTNGEHNNYTVKYAAANGALLWEKRDKGPDNLGARAHALALDGSGNVVVTGESVNTNSYFDYYTAKYAAANGALLWERGYNRLMDGGSDVAHAVAIDGSGNVVVTGSSGGDYYTAKYAAADGALLWEKRYNGGDNSDDLAQAVAVDGSGNVVVTGISNADIYTAKYSSTNGDLLWEQHYNGPANHYDAAWAVAVDHRGNVVVTGSSNNGSDEYANDFYTARYAAADGTLLWEKRYNGRGIVPGEAWGWFVPSYSVGVDSSGNVVVAGSSDNLSGSSLDYYTAKYAAADGALLWEQRFNGGAVNYDDLAQAVAVDGSGNVVVTGTSPGTDDNGYMAKYAAVDGALLWEKRHPGPVNQSIAVDGNGNVLLAGVGPGSWDFYTAKYASSNGALLWEKRYNGPAHLGDRASALAMDGSGNVVVTGQSFSRATPGSGDIHDIYTAKYASADGALLWEKRYNGPADLDDQGHAVTVDAKGDVIVSGVSATSGSPLVGFVVEGYTAKYASADGALLWEKRYKSPTTFHNSVIALDSDGNVALTGSSYNGTDNDYHTTKFASADGALLWEKRYSGLGNRDDTARAVAVDLQGNVVVTGTSDGGSTGADIYTVKYAGADGALLWEKRYNGPANLDDIAEAVRVDGNGNVVVTGRSASRRLLNGGFINDYYTAKYAAADGALLWEKRYNGPANGDDYPSSLALGPNGMVVVTGSSAGTGYSAGYAGYDYATVVYREVLSAVAIESVPSGVRLSFTGTAGQSYTIQRAPAVIGPWSTLNTPAAPLNGLIEYLEHRPPAGSAFYRTRKP